MRTKIIIPYSYLKEFSQLIMIGTQNISNTPYHTLSFTSNEIKALNFAKKLVKKYA
jgi:hypothetical protein